MPKRIIMLDSDKFDKTGLVGYWGLNGNTLDSSGNNRNGKLITNLSGQANYIDGKKGKAIQFIRSGYYSGSVVIDDPIFSLPNEFSAFCWIKKDAIQDYEDILSNRNEGSSGYCWIFLCGQDQSGYLALFSGYGAKVWRSSFKPIQSEWSFVGFTVKGSDLRIYGNGNNVGSFSNFVKKPLSIPRFNISGFNNGNEGFNGTIDEVSYWNRELSAEEVKKLYNNGKGIFI